MNKKEKLKLGIEAIKKRKKELAFLIVSHGCVLCRAILSLPSGTCLDCIAKEADFRCSDYCDMIDEVLVALGIQQAKWELQLEELEHA